MAKATKKAAAKEAAAAPAKKGHSTTRSKGLKGLKASADETPTMPIPFDENPVGEVVHEPKAPAPPAPPAEGEGSDAVPEVHVPQSVELAITLSSERVDTIETVDKVKTVKKKEITEDDIASADELKEAGIKKQGRMATIPFDIIAVREGFNLRYNYGDLESLANSIAAEGLLKPLTVDLLHGNKATLVDGERRFRAISLLRKRSKELKEQFATIEVFIQDKKSDEKGRIINMMVSNTGKPFDPMEEAEGFRRLRDEHGMTQLKDIADAVGRSIPYVEQRLILADASTEEKAAILEGVIKPTTFVRLSRITRDTAERKAIVEEALADAPVVNGKKRVKEEDINRVKDNRKGGKKVDMADMEEPASRPHVVKKAVVEEVLPTLDEALAELKEVEGLIRNQIVTAGVKEAMKLLRKAKKQLQPA